MERAIYQESWRSASNGRLRELGEVSDAFPTRAIGGSTAARGTRLIKRLGFNTLQGRMVRLDNRERYGGKEYVGSSNESQKEDSQLRAQWYDEQYGNGRLDLYV